MKVELRKKSALATSDSPVKAVEALVTKCRYLKVAELQVAGRSGNTRANAAVSFPDVVEILKPTENHKRNRCGEKVLRKAGASLRQLNPKLNEGLLRVGGRLQNAPVVYERKHPIILPYKHRVKNLISINLP